jgi:hypothetical protein
VTSLGFRRWISSKREGEEVAPPEARTVETEPVAPEPERQPVVNERRARALLASGTPPLPPDRQKAPQRWLERRSDPPPAESQAPAVRTVAPREWNIWELQRAVRTADDRDRQEEWSALFIHLREFANAEGDLPVEFDGLVRESFAGVLESEPAGS